MAGHPGDWFLRHTGLPEKPGRHYIHLIFFYISGVFSHIQYLFFKNDVTNIVKSSDAETSRSPDAPSSLEAAAYRFVAASFAAIGDANFRYPFSSKGPVRQT
jgi:hypothetical protein